MRKLSDFTSCCRITNKKLIVQKSIQLNFEADEKNTTFARIPFYINRAFRGVKLNKFCAKVEFSMLIADILWGSVLHRCPASAL